MTNQHKTLGSVLQQEGASFAIASEPAFRREIPPETLAGYSRMTPFQGDETSIYKHASTLKGYNSEGSLQLHTDVDFENPATSLYLPDVVNCVEEGLKRMTKSQLRAFWKSYARYDANSDTPDNSGINKTYLAGGDITINGNTLANLRVESLDPKIYDLSVMLKHFAFWNMIPKENVNSVVHQFVQRRHHNRNLFNAHTASEGEVSASDNEGNYPRRLFALKTIAPISGVSIQALRTKTVGEGYARFSVDDTFKTMLRINAHYLINGRSAIDANQYDGLRAWSYDIEQGDSFSSSGNEYWNQIFEGRQDYLDRIVIDTRGGTLTQSNVDEGATNLYTLFGEPSYLLAHPNAIATWNAASFTVNQRFYLPYVSGKQGSPLRSFFSSVGQGFDTQIIADQFIIPYQYVRTTGDTSTVHSSAPAAPQIGDVTLVASDSNSQAATGDSRGLGMRLYAVAAGNTYGLSPMTVQTSTPVTVANGSSVTIAGIEKASSGSDPLFYEVYCTDPGDVAAPQPRLTTGGADVISARDTVIAGYKFYKIATFTQSAISDGVNSATANTFSDRSVVLPNTTEAYLLDKTAARYYSLIDPSVLQLASTTATVRFACLMTGAFALMKPTQLKRYINIGGSIPFVNTDNY